MKWNFGLENGENVKVDFPQPKYEMVKAVNGSVLNERMKNEVGHRI